jgi:hypothetical protein
VSLRLLGLHVRKENDFIPTDSFSDVGNLLYDKIHKKGKDTVYRKTENEYQQIDRTEAGRDKGAESRSQMTVLVIKISMIWSRMEQ